MSGTTDDATQPTFRIAKRRKIWRKRPRDEEEEEEAISGDSVQEPTTRSMPLQDIDVMQNKGDYEHKREEQDVADVSSVALLRRQRLAKVRKLGIGFTKSTISTTQEENVAEKPQQRGPSAIEQAQRRFVPQMGQMTKETIENTERHM